MKLRDRIKTYNFWVSIASALFLIINLIGKRFNFTVDENQYIDIFTTICSVLVLLGIIVPPFKLNGNNTIDKFDDYEFDTSIEDKRVIDKYNDKPSSEEINSDNLLDEINDDNEKDYIEKDDDGENM